MKYNITLASIKTFIEVAHFRSFARAAEKLGMTTSPVSEAIKQLEKTTKMTLFARTTREVNLTSEGKKFLNFCNQIMAQFEELDYFLERNKEVGGVFKIVIPPYFSRYHIVPYLKEFLTLYPNLTLEITLTENPVNIIEEGHDLQIRIQKPEE